jgi:hypothetical protein
LIPSLSFSVSLIFRFRSFVACFSSVSPVLWRYCFPRSQYSHHQNLLLGCLLINVDTEKSEVLVNNRFAYVSVSRARHDAQIYMTDDGKLSHVLSRERSQPTATEVEQQPTAPKTGPASPREVRSSEKEQGNSLGVGLA